MNKVTYRNMVLGKAKQQGITAMQLSLIMDVSKTTMYRLLDTPDKLTRRQLKALHKHVGISMPELLS